jgi:D-alanyl-D-alanine carboxypeptidase
MKRLALTAAVTTVSLLTLASTAFASGPRATRAAADKVLAAGAPGVLVDVRDGSRRWVVHRGAAEPHDASFRIGSVTQTYVATAVLQAVARGRLSLDDTLAKWLPGALPRLHEDEITVRMLLDHTSGVPDPSPALLAHPSRFPAAPVTPAKLVAKARGMAPAAAPGTFAYSNADYWLLAMILRRATGHAYTRAIADGVLRPAHLRHTVLPHDTTRLPKPHLPGPPFNASWASSSGGMIATTGDLNHFTRALFTGRLLPRAQLAAMEHDGVAVPANPMGVTRYGLGLVQIRLRCGTVMYGNMGGLAGYTTWMLSTADGRRRIAVAADTDERPRVDRAIRGVVQAALC